MNLVKIFDQLFKKYGPQGWWPILGKKRSKRNVNRNSIFEICTGAILTQNTAWLNVEKALRCLTKANLMAPEAILKCSSTKLQKCVRSSGYYKQKAKRLKIFSKWIVEKYQSDWQKFFCQPLERAREELLSLWGIGPETADSVLLYAGRQPIFVIDTYTKRLCHQHGVEFKTYDDYREFFERGWMTSLAKKGIWKGEKDTISFFQEFHALIVRWGKENRIKCKK